MEIRAAFSLNPRYKSIPRYLPASIFQYRIFTRDIYVVRKARRSREQRRGSETLMLGQATNVDILPRFSRGISLALAFDHRCPIK